MSLVTDPHQETDNARKYRARGVEGALLARFRARLLDIAAPLEPAAILDAGCGEGLATEWLAGAFPHAAMAGVDARSEAIEQARERLPLARLEVGDLYDLPFGDGAFDLVVCTEVLEHLEAPGEALAELARVSAGSVIVTVPHEPFFRAGNVARGRYLDRLGSTPGHLNTWGRRGLLGLAAGRVHVEQWFSVFPWQAIVARPLS